MSTASALSRPLAPQHVFSLWLLNGFKRIRGNHAPAPASVVRPLPVSHQEAEKLRSFARDMMRIDPGSAADMFAAADRHEFGCSR